MRRNLRRWIAASDTRQNIETFGLRPQLDAFGNLDGRTTDLYFSLLDELFDSLRQDPDDPRDWATLGNALAQLGRSVVGDTRSDAFFFAAVAFYSGGYSASAYLAMRQADPQEWSLEAYRASYDLLARPAQLTSQSVRELLAAVREGRIDEVERMRLGAEQAAAEELMQGPEEWVAQHVYASLVTRFSRVNLRSILPEGAGPGWNPLVESFFNRTPPVWEFFPSQIQAIDAGLLTSGETYSLQMPTGAGKTALTETLIFNHLTGRPGDIAVLLVPYRALARELRNSLARRLLAVNLPTKTIYGGTVPTRDESQGMDAVRAIVATPEALTGLLGRSPELLTRISLAICDEGHLLDEGARGIGLELLLARLRTREEVQPRIVFISAIVPNIEEINVWLGGSHPTVVRSDFRPAEAEYAVLRPTGRGRRMTIGLEMHPVSTTLENHTLPEFLEVSDFEYMNPATHRKNTYGYSSFKTQAVAAARKCLGLGVVAVFAATKTGDQGVVGLADELLNQLEAGLPLPDPSDGISEPYVVSEIVDYLEREYGVNWIGTRLLQSGVVIHHGDIPQETREALEELLINERLQMVLCTGTLAEGVNLPLRTLVLYAVRRRSASGQETRMLTRDIRNLIGRVGRPGSSTKGLVICANRNQWPDVRRVATGQPGEDVHGALAGLLNGLQNYIRENNLHLTNGMLEDISPDLYPLVDGIDATLIELLHDELGDESFQEIASSLADRTFASKKINSGGRELLSRVFVLRASRITEIRMEDRLPWVRESGARARLLDSVINHLAPSIDNWEMIYSPLSEQLLDAVLDWVYSQPDFVRDLRDAYRDVDPSPVEVRNLVQNWIAGWSFSDIAEYQNYDMDTLLRIHGRVIAHALMTLVEQGIALLERYLVDHGRVSADAVTNLADYLRFGVHTPAARMLMSSGMRHRRAAVALGSEAAMSLAESGRQNPNDIARTLLEDEERWRTVLGPFVYRRTLDDVDANNSPGSGFS